MKVIFENCNNIDHGSIELHDNVLNIKYAINGTGKSTIAKAICYSVADRAANTQQLHELLPFKCATDASKTPRVSGTEALTTTRTFDEAYVNDFVFQPDELVKGSFDIFIRDATFDKGMQDIETCVADIKNILAADKDIEELIADLAELSNGFGKPTKSGIHASSTLSKAMKDGNKIAHIPEALKDYKEFIQRSDNFKWIKWQLDGKAYLTATDNCPYCVSNIKAKKADVLQVSAHYDAKSVESLNKIVAVFERLAKYFSDATQKNIKAFISNSDGYNDDQVAFLREVRDQIDRLHAKFVNAQNIGFRSLKDVDTLVETLKTYSIDLGLYSHLQSDNTRSKAQVVNDSLESVLNEAGKLQGSLNKQKSLIERLVRENSASINAFLKNAGYDYSVTIKEADDATYKLKLTRHDFAEDIVDVRGHLSFGERNAFALVLFMYDVLKTKPTLVVLDDPISSFDRNKKYAIVDMLFTKSQSLRGKTVLLLTHDFEPVVDMLFHHADRFERPKATFLENKHGTLTELEIQKADIRTFIDVNTQNITDAGHEIAKLVYLRRLFEVTHNRDNGYQLLSNLFHKRATPEKHDTSAIALMTDEERRQGAEEISNRIPGFDYSRILSVIQDDTQLRDIYRTTESNYERLHIYRLYQQDKSDIQQSPVIRKFINETFHIENEYIYQVNPRKYQLVPQYVIDLCDEIMIA